MSETLSVVDSTVETVPAITAEPTIVEKVFTLVKNLYNFARKGKGATGFYTLPVFGLSNSMNNGLVVDLSYKHYASVDIMDVLSVPEIQAIENKAGLLLSAIDAMRRENNGQGNEKAELSAYILNRGTVTDKSSADALASETIRVKDSLAKSNQTLDLDAFLDGRKAVIASQRPIPMQFNTVTNPAMQPRLVDNRS